MKIEKSYGIDLQKFKDKREWDICEYVANRLAYIPPFVCDQCGTETRLEYLDEIHVWGAYQGWGGSYRFTCPFCHAKVAIFDVHHLLGFEMSIRQKNTIYYTHVLQEEYPTLTPEIMEEVLFPHFTDDDKIDKALDKTILVVLGVFLVFVIVVSTIIVWSIT